MMGLVLPAAGCGRAPDDGSGEPAPTGTAAGTPPAATPGELVISEASDSVIKGTFTQGERTLSFEGHGGATTGYDITVRLNGAVLTAANQAGGATHRLDGVAEANGGVIQLSDDDHALLDAFQKEMDRHTAGATRPFIQQQLLRLSALWSQYPSSLALKQEVSPDQERTFTSICSSYLQWRHANHDCDHGGDYAPGQFALASVGERWDTGPGGQTTHEFFQDEPFWHSSTFAHKGGAYIAGDCLGHCGADCPAGGSNQILTQDCLDHDQCVSGNHSSTSLFCDDEFTQAVDDFMNAPACPGTGIDPQSIRNWETVNFPNQGVERKTGPRAICYSAHIQDFNWTAEVCDDSMEGFTDLGKRIEAIKIRSPIQGVSVCYKGLVQGQTWSAEVCDNAVVGTTGQGLRLEGLVVRTIPDSGHLLQYTAFIQSQGGWQPYSLSNEVIGAQGLRMDAVKIKFCAHEVCQIGAPLIAGSCTDSCVAAICAADSFCCNNSWDSICKGEVHTVCGRPGCL
jgi:hypothetical protein